jgi:hypothetical protein
MNTRSQSCRLRLRKRLAGDASTVWSADTGRMVGSSAPQGSDPVTGQGCGDPCSRPGQNSPPGATLKRQPGQLLSPHTSSPPPIQKPTRLMDLVQRTERTRSAYLSELYPIPGVLIPTTGVSERSFGRARLTMAGSANNLHCNLIAYGPRPPCLSDPHGTGKLCEEKAVLSCDGPTRVHQSRHTS